MPKRIAVILSFNAGAISAGGIPAGPACTLAGLSAFVGGAIGSQFPGKRDRLGWLVVVGLLLLFAFIVLRLFAGL